MYGSYKVYDNTGAQTRAQERIYQFAEASEKHLRQIRIRLRRQHRILMQKKAMLLSLCLILGVLAMFTMLS